MDDVDLHGWFEREELEPCPVCGEQAGIRLPTSGSLLCLVCGAVAAAEQAPADESSTS